jgi:hypothetical protein
MAFAAHLVEGNCKRRLSEAPDRIHGLTHETLQRGVRRERIKSGSEGGVKGLVAVELTGFDVLDRPQEGCCGLEVILSKDRRIGLSRDFDAVQLRRAAVYCT